jgi:hypothetical protein
MRSNERRESVRVNYLCECQVESEGLRTGPVTGRINDLSLDGVFIDSMLWLPIGSTLKLKFKVQDRRIRATGEVRYFMPHVGMGVRFIDLDPYDREVIESVVYDKPMPAPPALLAPGGTGPLTARTGGTGPPGASPAVMSGNLSVVNLFDVIHMIESGGLTGCLSVQAEASCSEIYFNDGVIVGASGDSATGITALNRILGVLGETFEFHGSDGPFDVTIRSSSNTSLILDMLTHKDHDARATLN